MKKLVHTRKISMRTSDLGDHTIEVEGDLIDHRYRPEHQVPSGGSELVHHMVIRLKIKGPAMFIEQAEATMPHHPRQECPVVLPWIRKLEGVRIAPGFTMKVKRVIGGKNGCAHLRSLVLAMGNRQSRDTGPPMAWKRRENAVGNKISSSSPIPVTYGGRMAPSSRSYVSVWNPRPHRKEVKEPRRSRILSEMNGSLGNSYEVP